MYVRLMTIMGYISNINVNFSRYRSGVGQRVGRGIALLFHDRGTIRGWVVSSTPRPHFTPRKDPVPILQEAGWAPGPVWTGGKSRPQRDFFFWIILLSLAQYTTLFVDPILTKAVMYTIPGLVQLVRVSCWWRCWLLGVVGGLLFWVSY